MWHKTWFLSIEKNANESIDEIGCNFNDLTNSDIVDVSQTNKPSSFDNENFVENVKKSLSENDLKEMKCHEKFEVLKNLFFCFKIKISIRNKII